MIDLSTLPRGSTSPPGSSEWWIERLMRHLWTRQARFGRLESYYRGQQDTQRLASDAWMESGLVALFPHIQANHSKLIVNAAAGRLVVLGFRLADELRADTEAARIWRRNDMEALSDVAHTEALVKGECPVLVEPGQDGAVLTPQSPDEVIVWHAPGDRRIRLAALKTWWADDERRRMYTLYLPDRIERWQDRDQRTQDQWGATWDTRPPTFQLRERRDAPAVVANPLGEVPIVVLPNDPRLAGAPEGEHESVITLIDSYTKTLMDMLTTSHEMAFPQRHAAGVQPARPEVITDPSSGSRVALPPQVQTGQRRWVTSPNPEASFGQFATAQLDNYVKELDTIRADIATITFTPYHFLLNMPSSVPPSGESITATEAALVDKVKRHQRDKGAGWRHLMRLAFRIAGDEGRARAAAGGSVIWGDPERRTESQHIDALGKLVQMLGVPAEAAWELIPASPEQIERWLAIKAAQPEEETEMPAGGLPVHRDLHNTGEGA